MVIQSELRLIDHTSICRPRFFWWTVSEFSNRRRRRRRRLRSIRILYAEIDGMRVAFENSAAPPPNALLGCAIVCKFVERTAKWITNDFFCFFVNGYAMRNRKPSAETQTASRAGRGNVFASSQRVFDAAFPFNVSWLKSNLNTCEPQLVGCRIRTSGPLAISSQQYRNQMNRIECSRVLEGGAG